MNILFLKNQTCRLIGFLIGVSLMAGLLTACHTTSKQVNSQPGVQVGRDQYQVIFTTQGDASFYANKFQGRPTASGELYNMNLLTAAHRDFPFGTLVRVTNLTNLKSVVVKVNDRGPFSKSRIIDLSLAAAKLLDFIQQGVAKVKIERLEPVEFSSK